MLYAQFYQWSIGFIPGSMPPIVSDEHRTIIEACGDRSVIILDARVKRETLGRIAEHECEKRGYIAWRIFEGDSFTRSRPVSQLWHVRPETKPESGPAWLSAHGM